MRRTFRFSLRATWGETICAWVFVLSVYVLLFVGMYSLATLFVWWVFAHG